jgi:hypothetical protein
VLTGEFARFFEGEVAEAAQPHLAGPADNHIAVDQNCGCSVRHRAIDRRCPRALQGSAASMEAMGS